MQQLKSSKICVQSFFSTLAASGPIQARRDSRSTQFWSEATVSPK